ncbi:MAG: helix-turn-helix transcriptional regulator, partial [Chloroflexi bacterium]|nr:helix-turn-helix transcriptional regulator [Chloroflexota bacterium]
MDASLELCREQSLQNPPEFRESEPDEARIGQPSGIEWPHLTKRELEVLQILATGGRNKDVAEEMTVSLHTVKFHIENLYDKLEVRTRG